MLRALPVERRQDASAPETLTVVQISVLELNHQVSIQSPQCRNQTPRVGLLQLQKRRDTVR